MKILKIILFLFCYTVAINAQSVDKNHPILTDKFTIAAGVYFPVKTVSFDVNGSTGNDNRNVDFGESIGFDSSQATFSIEGDWRFSPHWKLGVEYYSIDNTRRAELTKDVDWGDYTFKNGTFVQAGFSLDLYRVFFGRIISQGQKHEFGAGIGVHLMDVEGRLEGAAYINDEVIGDQIVKAQVLAPLPNIGIWYYLAPIKNLAFIAKVDWFSISVGEYSGSLWNVSPGLNYQILNKLGIGVNYRFFDVTAKVNKSDWDGQFSMTFSGPVVSLTTNF